MVDAEESIFVCFSPLLYLLFFHFQSSFPQLPHVHDQLANVFPIFNCISLLFISSSPITPLSLFPLSPRIIPYFTIHTSLFQLSISLSLIRLLSAYRSPAYQYLFLFSFHLLFFLFIGSTQAMRY